MAAKRKNISTKPSDELTGDEQIVKEAYERFRQCMDWESTARARYLEDTKFYYGDADNGYQWPIDVRKNRDVERKPVLTVNKARQYCLQITNESRRNKPSVKIKPVGERASFEGAQVMEGIVRSIEYRSRAQVAYDTASGTQVAGGIGYWRVLTQYCDDKSFNQELIIKRTPDPLKVLLDCDIQEQDGSDARYGFVFEDVPRDKFNKEHAKFKDIVGTSNLSELTVGDWVDDKHVRVAEYYRVEEKMATLFSVLQADQSRTIISSLKLTPEIIEQLRADPNTREREVLTKDVRWYKIAGDQIIEKGRWDGSTIPIVRVIGEESVIEGKLDRKGHIRYLKDPARVYNYWTSAAVEAVALQTKTPYVGPAAAVEGYETYWRSANTKNHSMLPYNHIDDQGNKLERPMREQPPVMPEAYIKGLQISAEEMRMVSGQYQSSMGEPSNERSGKAIQLRQRDGDDATYHFIDNLGVGIQYTGRILIEMIPKVYDTKRTIQILGLDGTQSQITIDPSLQEEMQEVAEEESKVSIIFNPGFAMYSVEADIGPAYATRRQEAFNAFVQILGQSPQLVAVAGDLMFRAADFPLADQLADRLKRMVPSALLGKGPSPEVQQLTQVNQQLQAHLTELINKYATERSKREYEIDKNDIHAFTAETERMKVLLDKFNPQEIAQFTAQLVLQTLNTQMPPAPANGEEKGGEEPRGAASIDPVLMQYLTGTAGGAPAAGEPAKPNGEEPKA